MYVYMYIYVYIYTYRMCILMHIHTFTYMHVYIYICFHTFIHIYTYIYIYVYIHICIHTYRSGRKSIRREASVSSELVHIHINNYYMTKFFNVSSFSKSILDIGYMADF